jgi:chaperonin GroES
MKFRPLFDRMVVVVKETDKTKGGIFLPQDVHTELTTGVVVACGDGAIVGGKVVPLPVKVGDTIIFSRDHIESLKIEGEQVDTIKINGVIGVLEK